MMTSGGSSSSTARYSIPLSAAEPGPGFGLRIRRTTASHPAETYTRA
jgi:hypothetical protein